MNEIYLNYLKSLNHHIIQQNAFICCQINSPKIYNEKKKSIMHIHVNVYIHLISYIKNNNKKKFIIIKQNKNKNNPNINNKKLFYG